MEAPTRTAQKMEVTFRKVIHLRDYENEEFTGSLTATFNRALTPAEGAVEIAKLQAELESTVFEMLYQRKLITTHEYTQRLGAIVKHLSKLGVADAENYLKGGADNG